MKIISNFRDFYDGSFANVDNSFHYVRREQNIIDVAIKKSYYLPTKPWNPKPESAAKYIYVFFCGITYCGVLVNGRWAYNEKAIDIIGLVPKEKRRFNFGFDFKNRNNFFDRIGENCHAINIKHNSPIVIYGHGNGTWENDGSIVMQKDAKLSNYGFMSAVDPFQAFQKIQMFISNDLAGEKFIDNATNKDKILAHGFDKWSFRSPDPPKRKQK